MVVGGGIVGVCTAYSLARRGRQVTLVDKSELTAGSTWHAAGLITAYHPTPNVKRVHWDSLTLYSQITQETGQEVSQSSVLLSAPPLCSLDRVPPAGLAAARHLTRPDGRVPLRALPPAAQAEPDAAPHSRQD